MPDTSSTRALDPLARTSEAIFAAVMPPVSLLWITLGAGVLSRSGRWLNRGSALWLALLSVLLAARAMAG